MSIEILDCLKRKRDICIKNVIPIIPSQNTAFRWTPALNNNYSQLNQKGGKNNARGYIITQNGKKFPLNIFLYILWRLLCWNFFFPSMKVAELAWGTFKYNKYDYDKLKTKRANYEQYVRYVRFYTRGRIIRPEGEFVLAVFILKTCYPSGRTWTNICKSSAYASLV